MKEHHMPEELPVPDGAPAANESTVDWEQRYKDTHSNWNTLNERFTRFEKDPNALIEFIQEKHPDLLAEDDEEPDTEEEDFDDPRDAQIAALEQRLQRLEPWQQDVENERGERRFNTDLTRELGERTVNDRVKTWIKDRTVALGNNPDALKKAVSEWAELEKELKGEHIEQVTKSKKTQHVPAGGQPGTQVPNLDDKQERHAWLKQRVREMESQQ